MWFRMRESQTSSHMTLDHVIPRHAKKALCPLPLAMMTGKLVNLEKTSEMSPMKRQFLASDSNKTFGNFDKKFKKLSN